MKIATIVSLVLTGIGTTVIATSAPASAANFSFNNISGGDTVGDAFLNNFSFDVTDNGNNTVLFKLLNNASGTQAGQSLKQVAFSSGNNLLSNMKVNVGNSSGVSFESKNQNLSQSNNISEWIGTTFGASTKGGNSNALQGGESLGITFNANYNAVLTALDSGALKVGIHVGSLPAGASDSYVNAPSPKKPKKVPEPATAVAFGLFAVGALKLTTKNKKLVSQA